MLKMRITLIVIFVTIFSGCASTYEQNNLTVPTSKLLKDQLIVISTPTNGFYGQKEYRESGNMTALAVRAAFVRFSTTTTISTDCKELICLKNNNTEVFDYYVIPKILHWEDRNTEWSGRPDKIEILLSIYEGKTWKNLASTTISGKSSWATFGGDHPQDLLQEPLNSYIDSLY